MKKCRKLKRKVLSFAVAFSCICPGALYSIGSSPTEVFAEGNTAIVEETHPTAGVLLHNNITVTGCTSVPTEYWTDISKVVNGDINDGEGWHSVSGVKDAFITLDLGSEKEISYVSALPRGPESNGDTYWGRFIKDFDLYITDEAPNYNAGDFMSDNQSVLGNADFSGSFDAPDAEKWQSFSFDAVTGQYVTIHVKSIQETGDNADCINVREFALGYPDDMVFDSTVDYSRNDSLENYEPNGMETIYQDKWGLFCHFLGYGVDAEEWERRVNAFDVESYAKSLYEMGAGYVILTLQQGSEYICRPLPNILKKEGNLNRNRLGTNCYGSSRDLPADLYKELKKYGIKLYLYQATDFFTVHDETGEDLTFKVIDDYMREYKEKGVKISGWYFDGVGSNTYRMAPLYGAVKKHDVDCSITFNTGVLGNGNGEDFAQVEAYDFLNAAYYMNLGENGKLENGEASTVCTYLSQWYGQDGNDPLNSQLAPNFPGPRYSDEQLIKASVNYIRAGGSVTYDVPVFYTKDGETIDTTGTGSIRLLKKYTDQLNKLGQELAKIERDNIVQPAERIMLNDTDSQLQFDGAWEYKSYSGQPSTDYYGSAYFTDFGVNGNPVGAHTGDFRRSNEKGAVLSFTIDNGAVSGSKFIWYGRSGVKMGKASVQIDDQEPVIVDCYGEKMYSQDELFTSDLLGPGKHTVKITVLDEKNEASEDTYIYVDAIGVFPQKMNLTIEEAITYINDTYIPAVSDGKLVLPDLQDDISVRVVEMQPESTMDEVGNIAEITNTKVVEFKLELTKDGETMTSDPFTLVLSSKVQKIPQSDMSVTASSTQEQDSPDGASAVLDGDKNTIWHSQYSPASPLPQYLTVDLGMKKNVYKVEYLPRQNMNNAGITKYEIQISDDGDRFTTVASGEWAADTTLKTVQFVPAEGRYVRLAALKGIGENQFVACAELNIYENSVTETEKTEITAGDTAKLEKTINGTFTSMNTEIVIVDDNGCITGNAAGSTYVVLENQEKAIIYPITVNPAQPADKTALEKSIRQAEEIDTGLYTEESVKVLMDALGKAYRVLEDETLTVLDQDLIDEAREKLDNAMKELTRKEENNGNNADNENNGSEGNNDKGNAGEKDTSIGHNFDENVPETGDISNAVPYITAVFAGFIAMLVCFRRKILQKGRKDD